MHETVDSDFFSENSLKTNFLASLTDAFGKKEITSVEREWLKRALAEDESARTGSVRPLNVNTINLTHPQWRPFTFKGACVLSEDLSLTDSYYLYTVIDGLKKFDSWNKLVVTLTTELAAENPRLYCLAPLEVRAHLKESAQWTISKTALKDNIFEEASDFFSREYINDLQMALLVISDIPSIRSTVREKVRATLTKKATNNTATDEACQRPNTINLETQIDALADYSFEYFVKGSVFENATYEYLPAPACGKQPVKTSAEIELEFISLVAGIAAALPDDFAASVRRYWSTAEDPYPSMEACVVATLSNRFTYQLLQARSTGLITPSEFNVLHDRAHGKSANTVKVASLTLTQDTIAGANIAGWFCLFTGKDNEKVVLISDEGLELFNSWSALTFKVTGRFQKILDQENSGLVHRGPSPKLLRYISRHDQFTLQPDSALDLAYTPIDGDVWTILKDQLLNTTLSNIDYLAAWLRNYSRYDDAYTAHDYASLTLATVDDALDIRSALDDQLLNGDVKKRWGRQLYVGETTVGTWQEFLQEMIVPIESVKKQLDVLDEDINTLLSTFPSLLSFTQKALAEQWEKEQTLSLQGIINYSFDPLTLARTAKSLEDTLLEHVTQYHPLPSNADGLDLELKNIELKQSRPLTNAESSAVYQLLSDVANDFDIKFKTSITQFLFEGPLETPSPTLKKMANFKDRLLWAGGYYYFMYEGKLSFRDTSCIGALSSGRTVHKRVSYYNFSPDIHSVSLYSTAANISAQLRDCFLITERGGLQSESAGHVIFWSPRRKFEAFSTLDHCVSTLRERLLDKTHCFDLIDTLTTVQRDAALAQQELLAADPDQLFEFSLIEDDYLISLTRSGLEQHVLDITHALDNAKKIQLSREGVQHSVQNYIESIRAAFDVATLRMEVNSAIFKKNLPELLSQATLAAQREYLSILERYRNTVKDNKDYLNGIPNIGNYALNKLTTELEKKYPGQNIVADTIEVTITQTSTPAWSGNIAAYGGATSSVSISLKDYALTGYSPHKGLVTVTSTTEHKLPATITAHSIYQMVRALDIGATYRAFLEEKLSPQKPEFKERFSLFSRQLAPQALEAAFRDKLIGILSDTAYRYIEHVLNHPNGLARTPRDGTSISIRAMQICTSPSATPDAVKGMYIIGPDAPVKGPFILWVTYNSHFSFKEYLDEPSMVSDLLSRESLQQQVLLRLDPSIRKKYDNGGFQRPHLTYITQTLASLDIFSAQHSVSFSKVPIKDNLLLKLYRDNFGSLLDGAIQHSVTIEEADRESLKELFYTLLNIAFSFLPGKLSIPIAVWQSIDLLKSGVSSVGAKHWGEAITEFVTGLMVLISTRRKPLGEPDALKIEANQIDPDFFEAPVEGESLEMENHHARYRAEQFAALEPYIDHTVALDPSMYSKTTGIYSHQTKDLHYAVLYGNVVTVKLSGKRWRVDIGPDREGPAIKRESDDRWLLDTREPLLGGGPLLSRPTMPQSRSDFVIEAQGMDQINVLYPHKAAAIKSAHKIAVDYLYEAKITLLHINSATPVFQRHATWLKNFLSVKALTPAYIRKINRAILTILNHLHTPSMNPINSKLYITGRNIYNDPRIVAFTIPEDVKKFIYLDNNFFHTTLDPFEIGRMESLKETVPPFDFNGHLRATTLIHEVSHHTMNTKDIAYLNASSPYVELRTDTPALRIASKAQVIQQQAAALSVNTPEERLFIYKSPGYDAGNIIDASTQQHILDITGAETLAQARTFFLNDEETRVNVILSNADSLSLIISRLGHELERYVEVIHS